MNNFWLKLKQPQRAIYALAPLAGITDSPFRQLCREYGADVVYSEMASVAALSHAPAKTLELLKATKKEAPYVVQLFGARPEQFARAARLISHNKTIKADGLDINFGCPVSKVMKQGAGAALFKDLTKARQVIEAVLANTDLPVSVKVRSRVGQVTVIDFLRAIKDLPIQAVMIHGRSLAQGFSGPVDAKIIKQARRYFAGVILANGGVKDIVSAKTLWQESAADGVGIGRGALGRPWIFAELKAKSENVKSTTKNFKDLEFIKQVIIKHAKLVERSGGNFQEFRKHLCWYVAGLPNAKKLREQFIKVNSLGDVRKILNLKF